MAEYAKWSDSVDADGSIWVFGYGSLMWRPGFPHVESAAAVLTGYARSFCIWSEHHRGTPDRRGLVLGLAPTPDARCEGHVFRVAPEDWAETAAYLEERELRGYAYRPDHLAVDLADGRRVAAHCFIADPSHPHYAGNLAPDDAARIILHARGEAGLNRDYLINTVSALEAHGYTEQHLHDLLDRILRMTGELDVGAGI